MNETPPVWTGRSNPILPNADMDRSVAFYRGLGFVVELFRDGGYAYVTSTGNDDGVVLHLSLTDGLDPFVSAGMAYVTVEDVDALYTQIMATGLIAEAMDERGVPRHNTRDLRARWRAGHSLARITQPWNQPWGMREFALLDPDNNLIRVGTASR